MTSATDPPIEASLAPFPPESIEAFLICCAGEWLSLRSHFSLEAPPVDNGEGEAGWHSSERGELKVAYLAQEGTGEPGGLEIIPPAGGPHRLLFDADGRFRGSTPDGAETEGRWQLWPDGSLELSSFQGDATVKERIWFTKANLRLRSSVEQRSDGRPGRASFSSEIRRLGRPSG